jgi:hypothetical protein
LSTFRLTRCVSRSIRADRDGQGSARLRSARCLAPPPVPPCDPGALTAHVAAPVHLVAVRPDPVRSRRPGLRQASPPGKGPAAAFLFHPPAAALPAIYYTPRRDMAYPPLRIGVQFRSRLSPRGGKKSWPISDARNRPLTPHFRQANHPQKTPCRFLYTCPNRPKNGFQVPPPLTCGDSVRFCLVSSSKH